MASTGSVGPPPMLAATTEVREQQKVAMPTEPKTLPHVAQSAVPPAPKIPSINPTKPSQEASPPKFEIRKQDLGMKIYSQPADGQDTTVDIVAVHGLGADPTRTWTHPQTKRNWLQDKSMLPATIPSARIMGFCYESRWIGENAVWLSLESIATELLEALSYERLNCPDRPIVFIGHCLGGLVIQQVYLSVHLQQVDWPEVSPSIISGIVFLGTPHHGIKDGTLSTQGQIYDAILRTNLPLETNILGSIQRNNDVLVGIVGNFTRKLQNLHEGPQVYCFYEQTKTRVGMIVGLTEPLEYLVDITAGTLSGHKKASLSVDHFRMNKFEDAEDGNYKKVSRVVAGMASRLPQRAHPVRKASTKRDTRVREIPTLPAPIALEPNFAPRGGLLEELDKRFRASGRVALYGPPGTGKTHIAVEYAHRYHRDYPASHVHWVNASSAEQIEASFKRIAQDLRLIKDDTEIGMIVEEVHRYLRYDSSGHWLMILDGLEDDTKLQATSLLQAGKSLLDFIPDSVHSSVLITTQSKSLALRQAGNKPENMIRMPALTEHDASILLLGGLTEDGDKRRWVASMLQALDGLAIGLSLAQIYHKHVRSTIHNRELLDMIASQKNEKNATARALNLLFDLLEKNHHESVDFVLVLGVLNLPGVPSTFLERAQVSQHIPILVKYGLVEPSNDRRIYFITTAIRQCILDRLAKRPDEKGAIEALALATIVEKFTPETADSLLPCALAILSFDPRSASAKSSLSRLLSIIAGHFGRLGQHKRALKYLEQRLSIQEANLELQDKLAIEETKKAISEAKRRCLDHDQAKALTRPSEPHSTCLAKTEKELGRLQASKDFGANHHETVRKTSELAAMQLARPHEKGSENAISNYKRVLEWFKEKHGANDINMARHLYNLALAHEINGQPGEAEKLYKSALNLVNASLDNHEHLSLRFKILGNLLCLYGAQSRLDEAGQVLQTLLQEQADILGLDHPETLVTRHNACLLMQEHGMVKDTEPELRRVLDAQRTLLQPDNPATFRTARTLALTFRLLGRVGEAEGLFKETLRTQQRILGKDHFDTLQTGLMLRELQEFEGLTDSRRVVEV